jgi:hypothetical protein
MAIAVLEKELWVTVREFEGKSFMFHAPKAVNKLNSHPLVDKYGHSGASFGHCMRNVQFICKRGVDAFNTLYDSEQ